MPLISKQISYNLPVEIHFTDNNQIAWADGNSAFCFIIPSNLVQQHNLQDNTEVKMDIEFIKYFHNGINIETYNEYIINIHK